MLSKSIPAHRIWTPILVCLLVGGGVGAALGQGAVKGKAALPEEKKTSVSSQRYSNIAGSVETPRGRVGVVWVEGDFSGLTNKAPAEAVVGQKGFQFEVSALPIQVGTKVTFPNHDDAYHNVFSYSKAKRFDLGRYLKDEATPTVVFDTPGIVRLYCEIHEHMSATIVVVDSPFFTTTDTEGNFSLSGVPAGKYTLKAWLGKKTVVEKAVVLKDGETLSAELLGE